jgi:hypothetical protein
MTNTMQKGQSGGSPGSPSEVASTLAEKASDVRSAATDEARGVAQDAKYHARQVAYESRESLRSEASNQAARVASTLRELGGQLQSMAQSQTGGGVAVDVSRQLAGTASRVADKLETGGVDATLADIKSFARRRPGMFLVGAIGAGFAVGRLLKAADTHSLVEAVKGDDHAAGAAPALGAPSMPPSTIGLTEAMP